MAEPSVRQIASTDPVLLEHIRCGDADAFADLYDRHHERVFRIGERMLGDADTAEDVVQSVFISIWKMPPRIAHGTFTSWLSCVTKNRVRDVLRTRVARREAAWPEHLSVPDSSHDQVCERLDGARLRDALATLPEGQRMLIELGYFGERSHTELAELTRLPLGTVKTRIRSGLQKLRFRLGSGLNALADGIAAP